MKEYNKIIVYNPYTSFLQKIELDTNFHIFEIADKCDEMFYYFKNNLTNKDVKVKNLLYLNYLSYMYDRDYTADMLSERGILDFEYNSIVIEKGCPNGIVNKLKEWFKISDDVETITTTMTFNEMILNELAKYRGEL